MKAIVYYGPKDIRLTDLPAPSPRKGEVFVQIKACGICGSDIHGYLGNTGRRIPPMVMGHEFCGIVSNDSQSDSQSFQKGDRVLIQPVDFCGECQPCMEGYTNLCKNKRFFGVMNENGALEEYLSIPEKLLYPMPDSMDTQEGALVEAFAVAYCAVKKAGPLTNKNVLIVGGGTIGQMALLAAKQQNPKRIIVSDLSEYRLEFAKKQGADLVINPGKLAAGQTFEEKVKELLKGESVDIALEAVGAGATVRQAMSVLKPHGVCIWIGNNVKMAELDMQQVVTRELVIAGTFIYTHKEFGEAIDFIEANKIDLHSFITKVISIEEVPQMFQTLVEDTEHFMKVVVEF